MNGTSSAAAAKSPIRIPGLVSIAADLERTLTATTNFADVALDAKDADLAFRGLALAVNRAIDALATMGGKLANADLRDDLSDEACARRMDALVLELAGTLPPIRGGGPDDDEWTLNPGPASRWPAWTDSYVWSLTPDHDGPTPDEVLARDEFEPERTDEDWDSYRALSMGLSEADHLVAHGC